VWAVDLGGAVAVALLLAFAYWQDYRLHPALVAMGASGVLCGGLLGQLKMMRSERLGRRRRRKSEAEPTFYLAVALEVLFALVFIGFMAARR